MIRSPSPCAEGQSWVTMLVDDATAAWRSSYASRMVGRPANFRSDLTWACQDLAFRTSCFRLGRSILRSLWMDTRPWRAATRRGHLHLEGGCLMGSAQPTGNRFRVALEVFCPDAACMWTSSIGPGLFTSWLPRSRAAAAHCRSRSADRQRTGTLRLRGYADAYQQGQVPPPSLVRQASSRCLLLDGFDHYAAALAANLVSTFSPTSAIRLRACSSLHRSLPSLKPGSPDLLVSLLLRSLHLGAFCLPHGGDPAGVVRCTLPVLPRLHHCGRSSPSTRLRT